MKLVFFGSSGFSIPILTAIWDSAHTLDLIVTTPPQKKGRGQKETKTAVHEWALLKRVPVLAPANSLSENLEEPLRKTACQCLVVASYGRILPSDLLTIPSNFSLNVHPSLLPKYRGAAPIAGQILRDEKETGTTIAQLTSRLDAGEILLQERCRIQPEDDAATLSEKLASLGGKLILEALAQIESGSAKLVPQDESEASHASKLTKAMGRIDWNQEARTIHNQIRAFVPWPSAFTFWKGKRIKLIRSECSAHRSFEMGKVGRVLDVSRDVGLSVQAGGGIVKIKTMQPESGKPMSAYEFALGHKIKPGDRFE